MKESNLKIYFFSGIITMTIVIIGFVVYHNFFNEPSIIFNDINDSRKVSHKERFSEETKFDSYSSIIHKTSPSVVFIRTIIEEDDALSYDTGSGVIISPNGQIVTNAHVVNNAKKITISTIDNRVFDGELIAIDEQTDIAVIKIKGNNLPFAFFGNSDNLKIGDRILAIGNPFKLKNSVSAGIVSAKNRILNLLGANGIESFIQTDAAANPGNSGGALVNMDGELVGVMSAITSTTDNFQGYSFAIPSNIVKKIVHDLINYGAVQRARMGIVIKNTEGNRGVQIERVNKSSAADKGGLKSKDIILKINNNKISNTAQFDEIIAQLNPGDKIDIVFRRNEKQSRINITLTNSLNTIDLVANRSDKVLLDLGIILRDLTSLEQKSSNGVFVVSVKKGSKMDDINVEPNYIIQLINGHKILNVDDFIQKYNNAGNQINLEGIYKNYPGVFPYVFEKI